MARKTIATWEFLTQKKTAGWSQSNQVVSHLKAGTGILQLWSRIVCISLGVGSAKDHLPLMTCISWTWSSLSGSTMNLQVSRLDLATCTLRTATKTKSTCSVEEMAGTTWTTFTNWTRQLCTGETSKKQEAWGLLQEQTTARASSNTTCTSSEVGMVRRGSMICSCSPSENRCGAKFKWWESHLLQEQAWSSAMSTINCTSSEAQALTLSASTISTPLTLCLLHGSIATTSETLISFLTQKQELVTQWL